MELVNFIVLNHKVVDQTKSLKAVQVNLQNNCFLIKYHEYKGVTIY